MAYAPVQKFKISDDLTQANGKRDAYEAAQAAVDAAVAAMAPLIAARDAAAAALNNAADVLTADAQSYKVS